MAEDKFVLAVDLDGCVADFVGYMRLVYSDWSGRPKEQLTPDPQYMFPEWGVTDRAEYQRLHRFAVTQRRLFEEMEPIRGAPQALRRLSAEGVHIRIATYRLFISYFHEAAASQTVRWLEKHGVPYWDLCLLKDKWDLHADLFIEDNPNNLAEIEGKGIETVCVANRTNDEYEGPNRLADWEDIEELVRRRYYSWRTIRGFSLPESPGTAPPGEPVAVPND